MLVLEIDTGDAPEEGVGFEVKFKSTMEVGGVEEGMECVATIFFERSFMKAVSSDGNIDG